MDFDLGPERIGFKSQQKFRYKTLNASLVSVDWGLERPSHRSDDAIKANIGNIQRYTPITL